MAILFFDGFDRCTITKDLDRNYWSFQPQIPQEYEKYAFGGYSYDHTQDAYAKYYDYYSPNNATLPTGSYIDVYGNLDYIEEYTGTNTQFRYRVNRNKYPAFGSPYGFVALHNLDISDTYNLAPITYVELSGFSTPQSGQSFLSTRFLGIETKDTNYAANDKPGRFGHKHPLVAFCNGNTTGLLLSIVKVTGNHLDLVEGQKMTIGLQIEQDNGVSGVFDLNLSSDVNDYQIRSVYSDISGTYSPAGGFTGKILTIARNDTERQDTIDAGYYWQPDHPSFWTYADHMVDSTAASISPNSRWTHFGIGIIQTGSVPYIQLKIEDIDVLVIPDNDSISNKDLWDDKIYISGFNYDNVRYFNRTYNSDIDFREYLIVYDDYPFFTRGDPYIDNRYYMRGSVTLIDDVVLSDGSGTPNYFPGSATKVIPFTPGVSGNITNNGISDDGPLEWSTNSSSTRVALKNLDGDQGRISASSSGTIAAIRHSNSNIITPDDASDWRGDVEDAVGGIKFYTSAKKQFLDTSYQIIMSTGDRDPTWGDKVLLITNGNPDTNLAFDRTRNATFSSVGEVNVNSNIVPFSNHPSLEFNDSYIYTNDIKSLQKQRILENTVSVVDVNLFTLESFVYFTGDQPITLFSTAFPTGYEDVPTYVYSSYYEILCYTGWIEYNYYLQDTFMERVRLYFPENMNTGEWNHVALTRGAKDTNGGYVYPIMAYLNGVSGTSISRRSNLDYDFDIGTAGRDWLVDDYGGEYVKQYLYRKEQAYISGFYTNIDNNVDLGSASGITDFTPAYGSSDFDGSGLYSSPATGSVQRAVLQNGYPSLAVTLADFSCNYSGALVLDMSFSTHNGSNSLYGNYYIKKNNQEQFLNSSSTGSYIRSILNTNNISRANIPVASGDSLTIGLLFDSYATGIANVHIQSARILDDNVPVTNTFYYLPTGNYHYAYPNTYFYSHPYGPFANFVSAYDLNWRGYDQSTPFNTGPSFYGGHNLIADLRLTQGGVQFGLDWETRYETNFVAPTEYLPARDDNYTPIGDAQSLTKTRYGSVQQIYSYNNPIDEQPWATGLIGDPEGFLLGVKKL